MNAAIAVRAFPRRHRRDGDPDEAAGDGAPRSGTRGVLHDHVDTDALEFLVADGRGVWEHTFRVPEHEVAVAHDDTIAVDGEVVDTRK